MALVAEIVAGTYTNFELLDVTNLKIGAQLADVLLGNQFTLTVSSASVDHTSVEAVLGRPALRWIKNAASITTVHTSAPVSGDGSAGTPVTIADGALTNAKQANMAPSTVKSNLTGSDAAPANNSIDSLMDALGSSTHAGYQSYISNEIDLTTTDVGGVTVLIPARAGFFPHITLMRTIITQKGGTLTTQPTLSAGADGSFIDSVASTAVSHATAFAAGAGSATGVITQITPLPTYSHTTPVYFKQTVAAAGSSLVLKVKFLTVVYWQPALS